MIIKTLDKLSIPTHENTIFTHPDFSEWPSIMERNNAILQSHNLCNYRYQLLKIASDYTQKLNLPLPENINSQNVIATGHQVQWHHCGVFSKSAIANILAKKTQATVVHLTLDHCYPDDFLNLPYIKKDSLLLKSIPFGQKNHTDAAEFQPPPKIQKLKEFYQQLIISDKSFCTLVWQNFFSKLSDMKKFTNIADFLTFLQAQLYFAASIKMLYLPVSLMSKSPAFLHFAAPILNRPLEFAIIYNNAILQLKHPNNRSFPTPKLLMIDQKSKTIELPFWLITGTRKNTLSVTISPNCNIKINTNFQNNISIRPKAVTLALFARLYLASLFIHGVGGAGYEKITDSLIENFYSIKDLKFSAATATVSLKTIYPKYNPQKQLEELKAALRKMQNQPELYIDREKDENSQTITQKNQLIEISKNTNAPKHQKKQAYEKIKNINKDLSKKIDEQITVTRKKIKILSRSAQILNDRNFFFGTFPEHIIKNLANQE